MLRVNKKLSEAKFRKPRIDLCFSNKAEQIGYVLRFGDFSLYVSNYIAQVVNMTGMASYSDTLSVKRGVSGKGTIVSNEMEQKILGTVEGNTILLSSLAYYLNGKIPDFLKWDYSEWGTLNRSYQLFIVCLLSAKNNFNRLIKLYQYCDEKQKSDLFLLTLTVINVCRLNVSLLKKFADNSKFSIENEEKALSTSSNTVEQVKENGDNLGGDLSEKSDKVIVVERGFGNHHKSAENIFYDNLVEVVDQAPLYRGRTSWVRVLEILRDDERYREATSKYLMTSGYKLNVNNLRNWYSYCTSNALKKEEYKVISDNNEITDILSHSNYNNTGNNI